MSCGPWRQVLQALDVNVGRDEEIQVPVPVVVEERASRVPAFRIAADSRLPGHIREGAVAVVSIEDVRASVGDEQIVEAVVVVVADANPVRPPGAHEPGILGDVGERAVPIVLVKAVRRDLAVGNAAPPRTVQQEDVEPAVMVIVVESDPAAIRFRNVVGTGDLSVVDRPSQAGLGRHVDETDGISLPPGALPDDGSLSGLRIVTLAACWRRKNGAPKGEP